MAGSSYSSFFHPETYMSNQFSSAYFSRFQVLRGLPNYGLSCCVNALLQSFCATQELLALLNRWKVNDSGPQEKAKNVPEQLQKTLQAMQSDRFQADPHKSFLRCLDRNRIPMSIQHDADEVFLSIMNLVQEQMSDTELAQQIKCLYKVKVEEHLQCNECTYIQSGETYLLSLPLPLLHASNTLEQCFRDFFELQELDGDDKCFCERCGEKTPSKQGLKLIHLPPVVCVHLKRFRSDDGYTKKLHCEVSFPQALDFKMILKAQHVSEKFPKQEQSEWQYKLYAVIVHHGGAMSGHYTAYITHDGDTWYHADDSYVSEEGQYRCPYMCLTITEICNCRGHGQMWKVHLEAVGEVALHTCCCTEEQRRRENQSALVDGNKILGKEILGWEPFLSAKKIVIVTWL